VLLLVLVSVLCVVVFCFLVSWWVRVAPCFSFCVVCCFLFFGILVGPCCSLF
jgi:hypothetical protein